MKTLQFTSLVEREDGGYVALCPELDIASQGDTIDEAQANLKEAVELFLETAPVEEVERRYNSEVLISRFEAAYA